MNNNNNNEEKTKNMKKIKTKKRRMKMIGGEDRFFNDYQWNLIIVFFGTVLIVGLILTVIKIFYKVFRK
jgi:hypothetical protein